MFSLRLPARLQPNAWSAAVALARRSARPLLDLTETNPTNVGISYPPEVMSSLASADALRYVPEPAGMPGVREAVAAEYRARGRQQSSDDILLTSSTSEAYSWLFKLFCDPGDAVLVPQPSYPLFDLLCGLDGVTPEPYRLDYHGRWALDRDSVDRGLTDRTRAVLIVSPNNPTGSWLRADDHAWLAARAAERGLALIVDEVFADYPLAAAPVTFVPDPGVLTCALGGLSKSAGLPQMKLAWIAMTGPPSDVAAARARLEIIADTYLSVATPVQVAAPALLAAGADVREAIRGRVRSNLAALTRAVARHPAVTLLAPDAGWSAVLRVPAVESEEALVLRALAEADVVVHPGYFFDFEDEAFVVISLLPPESVFADGVTRLLDVVQRAAA